MVQVIIVVIAIAQTASTIWLYHLAAVREVRSAQSEVVFLMPSALAFVLQSTVVFSSRWWFDYRPGVRFAAAAACAVIVTTAALLGATFVAINRWGS